MDLAELSRQVEERYRRYLKTTFYFRDPALRASFEEALNGGRLSKGPYLEATPVFKRGQTPQTLFPSLLKEQPDQGFQKAVHWSRPLYLHQEQAIRKAFDGQNVIVATGTGSGKTESFLYPILLHLYREFQTGRLCPGVRALILYPMNALANDQCERLGEICKRLKEGNSPFQFTFGQYIGDTPEDEHDSKRHARDLIAERDERNHTTVENGHIVHGELVLRSEMRSTPPHILLTNYSMLEYLLLRPDDSPLFDNGLAKWWTFLVLDEAHQYRGSRGMEMAMLLRRLKQRLREGGRLEKLRCIATSATLIGGEGDSTTVAKFASDLFGETFHKENVILGEQETIPELGQEGLVSDDYRFLEETLQGKVENPIHRLTKLASKLQVSLPDNENPSVTVGRLLQYDRRATKLRRCIAGRPGEIHEIAADIFNDLPEKERVDALSRMAQLLIQTEAPHTGTPLLSARYHLLLRSLEGAFVSYWPTKQVFLHRIAREEERLAFEVALCRECGQHYFIGPNEFRGGKLTEAIRDPSHSNFGATFFRPIEYDGDKEKEEEDNETGNKQIFQLCLRCGEAGRDQTQCGHETLIHVIKEDSLKEDKADQVARCGACGYHAAGRDPVREVVHGTDGPQP